MIEQIITSSIIILVIVVLRKLLKNRISKQLQYALWLIVAIKLFVPFDWIASPLSVMNYADVTDLGQSIYSEQLVNSVKNENNGTVLSTEVKENTTVVANNQAQTNNQMGTNNPTETNEQMETNNQVSQVTSENQISTGVLAKVGAWLPFIWITGMVLLATLFIVTNLHFYLKLKRTRKRVLCELTSRPVYQVAWLSTSCIFGVVRPSIYLTDHVIKDSESYHHVILHEDTHYKHLDHIFSLIRCVCVVVYWFHPLVWIAASFSKRDSEIACDDSVIKRLGEQERIKYGNTLVEMMELCQKKESLFQLTTTMSSDPKSTKERIQLLIKKPRKLIVGSLVAVILAMCLIACTFTGKQEDSQTKSENDKVYEYSFDNGIEVSILPTNQLNDQKVIVKSGEQTKEFALNYDLSDEDPIVRIDRNMTTMKDELYIILPQTKTKDEEEVLNVPYISGQLYCVDLETLELRSDWNAFETVKKAEPVKMRDMNCYSFVFTDASGNEMQLYSGSLSPELLQEDAEVIYDDTLRFTDSLTAYLRVGVKTADTTTWIGFWTDDVTNKNDLSYNDYVFVETRKITEQSILNGEKAILMTDDVLDLNQDGEGDRILLRANNGNDNGVDLDVDYDNFTLKVGDVEIDSEQGIGVRPSIEAISLNQKTIQLMVHQYRYSDAQMTYIYEYDGKSLVKVGEIPSNEIEMKDGQIEAKTLSQFFQTMIITRNYSYENKSVQEISKDFYEHNTNAKVLQEITLFSDEACMNGGIALNVGDEIVVEGTNDKDWVRIRDVKSGEKGYLRISESNCIGFGVKSNTYYPWDLFEGLFFAG